MVELATMDAAHVQLRFGFHWSTMVLASIIGSTTALASMGNSGFGFHGSTTFWLPWVNKGEKETAGSLQKSRVHRNGSSKLRSECIAKLSPHILGVE
jgi:hypothetical protein